MRMETQLHYTGEELLCMPDSERYELADGELVLMPPPPGGLHGAISGNVYFALRTYASQGYGGLVVVEAGFYLRRHPDTVRAPDIAFYRHSSEVPVGYFETVPDIAIEVVSPSQNSAELESRVQDFLTAGVAQVWVLYPRNQTLHRFYPDGTARILKLHQTLEGDDELLPGLQIPLRQIFP